MTRPLFTLLIALGLFGQVYIGLMMLYSCHLDEKQMDDYSKCSPMQRVHQFKQPQLFIISETTSGGSFKYIKDLTLHYSTAGLNVIRLRKKEDVLTTWESSFREGDVLLFQYLFNTDFTFAFVNLLVLSKKLVLIIPVHDRYFLGSPENISTIGQWLHHANWGLCPERRELFNKADFIIFPSNHVYNFYKPHIDLHTMKVVAHIDMSIPARKCLPPIIGAQVNIGIITELSLTKGFELFQNLIQNVQSKTSCSDEVTFYIYSEYAITVETNVVVRGPYKESEIFRSLVDDQIHGLIFLNKHPETYSYALTKGLYSGLPMMYSDIGAIGERISAMKTDPYYANMEENYVSTNNVDLAEKFLALINVICRGSSETCEYLPPEKIPKSMPKFYDELFFESSNQIMKHVDVNYCHHTKAYAEIHQIVEPYAIYFPQFHESVENNANFFPGYTDIVNLLNAKLRDQSLLTPLRNVLGFYDLEKQGDVVEKQIKLAKAYGFSGFALYYYWFTTNTISNQHTVFSKVIDKFYQESLIGFSVFFVFCNEDWTSNIAFQSGKSDSLVINIYDEKSFVLNFLNLAGYFKHKNYRKIENQPIMFLHHPQLMSHAELLLFKSVGDRVAKEHGFNGILLAINDLAGESTFYQYVTHPQYKTIHAKDFTDRTQFPQRINYEYYTRHYLSRRNANGDTSDKVNSAFVNFDNSVRFFAHHDSHEFGSLGNKTMFLTKTKNNNIHLFKEFLHVQFDLYKHKKSIVSKIFLVNAWNEWGEQMAIEPSQEMGFMYLEIFRNSLLCSICGHC